MKLCALSNLHLVICIAAIACGDVTSGGGWRRLMMVVRPSMWVAVAKYLTTEKVVALSSPVLISSSSKNRCRHSKLRISLAR